MQTITDFGQFIIAWYNVPFSLSLLLFVGLAGLQLLGFSGEQDFDVDVNADVDADADVDTDVEAGDSLLGNVTEFMGIGQVPLTVILLILTGTFGFGGWVLNNLVLSLFSDYPSLLIIGVIPVAFVIGIVATSTLGRTLGRLLPAKATSATSYKQLVGQQGQVVSHVVNEQYGQVRVYDLGGNPMTVYAVVDPGKESLTRDQKVVLVEYLEKDGMFVVVTT